MDKRIERYFNETLNSVERINLLREIKADDGLKKEFIDYQNTLALLSLSKHAGDDAEGKASSKFFINSRKRKTRKNTLLKIGAYAAAIALIVLISRAVFTTYDANNKDAVNNTIVVPAGQRTSIILSDGTEIFLNSKSTLSYPSHFGSSSRKVKLTGEAYFRVAKNEKHPFIVSTDQLDVKVLGTTFNVNQQSANNSVSVSLLEGLVELHSSLRGSEVVTLNPSQCASYVDGQIHLSEIGSKNHFLWIDGIYGFEETKLSDIVNQLEEYYEVQIIIKDTSIADYVYTGKFRKQDGVLEILRIIQKIYKFKIDRNEDNTIITLSK